MKKRVIFLILMLFSFSVVNAASDLKITCPSKANAISTVECTLSLKPDNYELRGVQMNYSVSGGTYLDFQLDSDYTSYSLSSSGALINRKTNYIGTSYDDLGILKIKMPSSGSASVSISNIISLDKNNDEHSVSNVNKTIRVTDSNNYLSNIILSEGTIDFDKSKTTYDVKNINGSTIDITATLESSYAKLSGDVGKKNLNFGLNTFKITVTSEAGVNRIYTLNIYRNDNRDKTNTLSSLEIENYKISPDFNKNTVNYTLTVKKDVTSVKINATLDSDKSSFNKGYGPRTVNLTYGVNTILIKVTSESKSTKTYTIKITREDDRSSNNYLKSLNVSSGDFEFNKKTQNYSFTVQNEVTSIKVFAVAEDEKSKVSGAQTYNLKEGLNKINIVVTAENKQTRTYTLQVTRIVKNINKEVNNKLKSLEISNYQINFDPETTIYNLTIENESSLDIIPKVQDSTSSVVVNGNENLKDGSVIKLIVTAVDGSTKEYIINISKNEEIKNDDKIDDNNVVKVNKNRKLQIIVGVSSFLIIVVVVILFSIIGIKSSLKKRATLWK
ncbi:MAG: cadherin-like beta sandwich domain-containing protein [Mollicutes bacterium]|nr:cadherin-like beta sandwich domain-containing protein [Mollicutes bacterium]